MQLFDSEPLTKYPDKGMSNGMGQTDSEADKHTNPEVKGIPLDAVDDVLDDALDESLTRGFMPVLKNRDFLTLWSGQVFSQLADKVYLVLMIAIITSRFQNENQPISAWVSAIMVAFTIPAVLFGSVAGVFVDRWSKKAVLVATNLLRGILVLVTPTLLWLTRDWGSLYNLPIGFLILLGVTFLVSALTQFFAPAEQAVIPLIVKRRNLLSANSLYTTTMMASLIVGFAVGEPLLALADTLLLRVNVHWDFGKELAVGSSYAIAGILLLLLKTSEKRDEPIGETPHVFSDILDGLRYMRHHRRVRNALLQLIILFSVIAALSVLAVPLAGTLGLRPSQFGFLLATGGIGLACGAAILGHWGQRLSHTPLTVFGSAGVAGSLLGLALFDHNLLLAFLMTILLGGFAALVAIPMQTTIQAETPEDMRGKVFGLQNNAINIALSLPLALAGVAETIFGLRSVFFGLAALAVAGGVLNWYISGTGTNMSNKADK